MPDSDFNKVLGYLQKAEQNLRAATGECWLIYQSADIGYATRKEAGMAKRLIDGMLKTVIQLIKNIKK